MKRILCAILSFTLMLALAACADTGKDWQAQYDLGIRYLEDGDYEEAILAFSAAIKIDGSRPEAYVGRADAYIAVGEPEKALKDYKKAKRIAERSEENYEDLIEDLEDTIDELEEEIDREESQNPETEPGGAESRTVTVTDAYSGQFEQYGSTFCCHIPQIHLEKDLAAQVNAKIYDELSLYIESQTDEVTYSWGMEGEYLSVIVETDFIDWAWTNYYVYTICITTGELVSQETLLDAFGLSREDYSAMAYTTLEQIVTQFNPDQIGGQNVYDYIVSHTLSDENIQETIPYIGENGHLCMVAARYSPAGASFYYGMYDLVTGEQLQSLPCTGNHSVSGAQNGLDSYSEETFQDYADKQYALHFSGHGDYEDNLLVVVLTAENHSDYAYIAWVGDHIVYDISNMLGDNTTTLGQVMRSCISENNYKYSLDSNLAQVMDIMAGKIQALGLDSSLSCGSNSKLMTGFANYTNLPMTESTVTEALNRFTEATGISVVLVVEDSEDVFGSNSHTVSEINALVVQWYNNNIGGYESGYFTSDESDCFLVHDKCSVSVYFYNTDTPDPGTEALPFAVVQVDVNTGEMWDVMTGNSLAYLW